MTPTPHGQVPEALRLAHIFDSPLPPEWPDMVAAAAELRRQHARIAELEAVGAGGVQALSAAPEAIAKLRHLYQNMVNGAVRDTASAKRIAEGLLAPAIEALERAAPPAEQQAASSAVLKAIREANMQLVRTGDGAFMLVPYKVATAEQAAPKAAPGVGNSGFDHKTAADFLNGKTVSDEAVRKFVAASRWAHDERASLSATLLAMHGVLTSREAEIALLKKALLEAEAAPQQEAQEPVAYVHVPHSTVEGKVRPVVSFEKYQQDYADGIYSTRIPLYTAPQPAPAPLSEREAFEAWIEKDGGDLGTFGTPPNMHYRNSSVNNAWVAWKARAALAAQGNK